MAEPGVLTAAQLAAQEAAKQNPEIAEEIKLVLALKDSLGDSEIQRAYELYQKGDIDGMRLAILNSNFYKLNSKEA